MMSTALSIYGMTTTTPLPIMSLSDHCRPSTSSALPPLMQILHDPSNVHAGRSVPHYFFKSRSEAQHEIILLLAYQPAAIDQHALDLTHKVLQVATAQ